MMSTKHLVASFALNADIGPLSVNASHMYTEVIVTAWYFDRLWHGERETDANAVVKSDGTVLWIPRATYRTYCTTDGEHATCKFK